MVRELSGELLKIAQKELNERPKGVQEDTQHLKDWISKQPHLKARTDDRWLIAILRGCKFSLEQAKKKLDMYYTLRSTAPDITLRMKPTSSQFIDFLRVGTCLVLRNPKDLISPRVLLLRMGKYNTDTNNVADVICILYYMIQILVVEDDVATVLGIKVIIDYDGITMNHVAQATPVMFKKILAVSQDSMPLRLKGNNHINLPTGIEVTFKFIKAMINEKARERMKIHKSPSELVQHFPKEIIPVEYGGTGGTIAEITEEWVQKFNEYRSWMQEEEQLGTDETKRPGSPKTAESLFGTDGSFRKLEID